MPQLAVFVCLHLFFCDHPFDVELFLLWGYHCSGNTPLHLSVDEGLLGMTRTLLEEGAKFMKNNGDQTPEDVAKTPEMRELLAQWKAEHGGGSAGSSARATR